MEKNFKYPLSNVLAHEGGWSDHPRDPGGATMKGVTLAVFRRFYGKDKTKKDLHEISQEQLEHIYKVGYWDKCQCDQLPSGVDYAAFDAAVNSGPRRSVRWLQEAVGADVDGLIGPNTIDRTLSAKSESVIDGMCGTRLAFLKSLSTWDVFGKGWERRVVGVKTTASLLAGSSMPQIAVDEPFSIAKNGSTGKWVKQLQKSLKLPADGIFGKVTEAALKDFQHEAGLEVDGIAGKNTYQALGLISQV